MAIRFLVEKKISLHRHGDTEEKTLVTARSEATKQSRILDRFAPLAMTDFLLGGSVVNPLSSPQRLHQPVRIGDRQRADGAAADIGGGAAIELVLAGGGMIGGQCRASRHDGEHAGRQGYAVGSREKRIGCWFAAPAADHDLHRAL